MKVLYSKDSLKANGKIRVFLKDIVGAFNTFFDGTVPKNTTSKDEACSRLKLVLMHDRSKIAPGTLEKMKDELVDVISRYVDIDREALDLNLESESNTIALIASIPIRRAKQEQPV
jgi:cell division topological specificity factor